MGQRRSEPQPRHQNLPFKYFKYLKYHTTATATYHHHCHHRLLHSTPTRPSVGLWTSGVLACSSSFCPPTVDDSWVVQRNPTPSRLNRRTTRACAARHVAPPILPPPARPQDSQLLWTTTSALLPPIVSPDATRPPQLATPLSTHPLPLPLLPFEGSFDRTLSLQTDRSLRAPPRADTTPPP